MPLEKNSLYFCSVYENNIQWMLEKFQIEVLQEKYDNYSIIN